ncbi:NUDIX hydrolase [Candidatus Frankia nodulisporulans]|uniref:NUDIX hydrolase n=1 Tax=Candidatus Frankia nodulisporulans TaxID=2060052 RepID=UPI0013D43CBD|nr:NUDIX domain-containing protein [Candidatus Frankia nodulisporulans]
MHSVSVAGVVLRANGDVLGIRRRDTGEWQIPGGVLERDESIHDGVRREIAEETGLLVRPLRLTGVYLNLPRAVVAMVFLCAAEGETVAASTEEASEVGWLSTGEVRTRFEGVFAVRVADALVGRDEAFVRVHDGVSVLAEGAGGQGDY